MAVNLLQTKVFDVVSEMRTLPNGRRIDKTFVRHPGGAVILPLLDDGTILMVRNYRLTLNDWLLELPAGTLEPPESPLECATRELREETGHQAGRIEPFLSFYTAPGFCDERLYTFVAYDLQPGDPDLRGDEHMQVQRVSLSKALDDVRAGRIVDAKTIATLCAWALRKGGTVHGMA